MTICWIRLGANSPQNWVLNQLRRLHPGPIGNPLPEPRLPMQIGKNLPRREAKGEEKPPVLEAVWDSRTTRINPTSSWMLTHHRRLNSSNPEAIRLVLETSLVPETSVLAKNALGKVARGKDAGDQGDPDMMIRGATNVGDPHLARRRSPSDPKERRMMTAIRSDGIAIPMTDRSAANRKSPPRGVVVAVGEAQGRE